MGKYGEVAVKAVKLFTSGGVNSPIDAWQNVATEIFPKSPWSQRKDCPRGAFLGLCEEGTVKGIPPGRYTHSVKNKQYAMKALEVLKEAPELSSDSEELWSKVIGGDYKVHNQQMDVVISLWSNNLIQT